VTQQELQEVLDYEPLTGLFRWKVQRGSRGKIGSIAGSPHKNGYVVIRVFDKKYLAHRLAFMWMVGCFPNEGTDHLNHIKNDNRWNNLRECSNEENMKNRPLSPKNKTGQHGVRFKKNLWEAQITLKGKTIYLGGFLEFHEAVNARKNAEVLYGFHENHGT